MWEVLVAGIAFGFVGILGKWALALGSPLHLRAGEIIALRFLGASLLLWFYALASRKRALYTIPTRAIATSAIIGIVGYALFSSFYFEALTHLSAGLTALLLYTFPAWVALGSHFFLGEKLTLSRSFAIGITFLGIALLSTEPRSSTPLSGMINSSAGLGLLFGFLSGLFYALYILLSSRYLKGITPLSSALYVQTAAAIALGSIHLHDFSRVLELTRVAWPALLLLALVGTLIPITLFLRGLQKLRNTEASVLSTAEPITATLAAALILGERMGLMQVFGGFLVLSSMIWLAFQKKSGKDGAQ